MNHRNRLIALTIVLSVFGAACGSSVGVGSTTTTTVAETTTTVPLETTTTGAEGQTFVGADGVEVTITDTSRIVSLNGDITEVIFALGLGANVVGVDVTTTYPSEAA
ncbi:MAG: hemin ABC transporter substrate-binding protein, partial [Acidimicrobiia bacterium]|nr:hemin ABC transporter substrate-binding protein [Acidimicrobiia bacterium]